MGETVNFQKRVKKSGSSVSESRGSNLLSKEENDRVFRLLGSKCQSLATTVVQLFTTIGAEHSEWVKKDAGVLCLVKDNLRRSYFFRLYCPSRQQLIWEHEVYNSMEYNAPVPFLHTFEAEDCIAAFNFASEEEATWLRGILLDKLETKKQRREKKSHRLSQAPGISTSNRTSNNVQLSHQRHPQNNSQFPSTAHHNTETKKKKDKGKKVSKADIGNPTDFRHISHVGWDADKGFEYDLANSEDPSLQSFLHKAGVSEKHMQDRETRDFIYDFIEKNGGLDAVKKEAPPPPPVMSARSTPIANRAAPPPPPPRIGALPAPPAPSQTPPPLPPLRTIPQRTHEGAPLPPPPLPTSNTAPPPPPPPPPPVPLFNSDSAAFPPPPPPPLPSTAPPSSIAPVAAVPDMRTQLMESIRSGASLKHVDLENKNKPDSRGELLDQIRQGVELRSVQPAARANQGNEMPATGLAGALARALAERSRVIHSDSSASSDDDEDGDDEWED